MCVLIVFMYLVVWMCVFICLVFNSLHECVRVFYYLVI